MEKLTITTPPDVLSVIGHTLGFWPQGNLVCITLNGNSIGATLRIDLPRQPVGDQSDRDSFRVDGRRG